MGFGFTRRRSFLTFDFRCVGFRDAGALTTGSRAFRWFFQGDCGPRVFVCLAVGLCFAVCERCRFLCVSGGKCGGKRKDKASAQ